MIIAQSSVQAFLAQAEWVMGIGITAVLFFFLIAAISGEMNK